MDDEYCGHVFNDGSECGQGLHWLIHNRLENEFVEQVIALLERQD